MTVDAIGLVGAPPKVGLQCTSKAWTLKADDHPMFGTSLAHGVPA